MNASVREQLPANCETKVQSAVHFVFRTLKTFCVNMTKIQHIVPFGSQVRTSKIEHFHGWTPLVRLNFLTVGVPRSHSDTPHSSGRTPLDKWSARRRDLYLHNTQHSQETHIHAHVGFEASKREALDSRLRPRSHWDQQNRNYSSRNSKI